MVKKSAVEILRIMEKNARVSVDEISKMTGISKGDVQQSLKQFEKSGVIKGYRTTIDWEKAGVEEVYALVEIKVSLDRERGYDSVAERISKFPEVRSVRLVSGEYDLSVVVKGKSMKEVAYFIAEKIATLEQVRNTTTHFTLKMYKENGDILHEGEKSKRLPVSA
jgi:DNA-binding Lrp family transcriptional regulator